MGIFDKRSNIRPYEYPELVAYADGVRHSYWLHTEFNYSGDISNFKTDIDDNEREVIKRTMLAISQIEVAVKSFWGNMYNHLPKPEVGMVGATFSESEVRHMEAYAHLLELLGLNAEFENLLNVPAIGKRVKYLDKVMAKAKASDRKEYVHAILLFALLVEHSSLFSQFYIMMAFNKRKNVFKGISNAVEATSKEEQLHGLFGAEIINIIHKEYPEFKMDQEDVFAISREAYEAEEAIVNWIFELGELTFLPKDEVLEFIKDRMNRSLKLLGYNQAFRINHKVLDNTEWFDDEVIATKHVDFFYKRSINYNKKSRSVTSEDLF